MFAMIIIKVANSRLTTLALCFLLFLSCNPQDPTTERERGIRQREQTKSSVRTTGNQGVFGRYSPSDYDGPICDSAEGNKKKIGDEGCEEVCDRIFDREHRKCEKLAIELIKDLAKLFEDMSNIGNDEELSRRVNSFNFGVMIDIHIQPVLKLIENWNVRETAEFLIWTAKTSAVTLALEKHDKENQILKLAFETISDGTVEDGLAKDLEGYSKTFWALARAEKNKSAFIVAHNLLKDICSNKNCKMRSYCVREEFEDSRSQRTTCAYSNDRRSFRRVEHCYIHGPDVWSYWLNLNRERNFNDSDFSVTEKMNEQVCNKLCEKENCKRD